MVTLTTKQYSYTTVGPITSTEHEGRLTNSFKVRLLPSKAAINSYHEITFMTLHVKKPSVVNIINKSTHDSSLLYILLTIRDTTDFYSTAYRQHYNKINIKNKKIICRQDYINA